MIILLMIELLLLVLCNHALDIFAMISKNSFVHIVFKTAAFNVGGYISYAYFISPTSTFYVIIFNGRNSKLLHSSTRHVIYFYIDDLSLK